MNSKVGVQPYPAAISSPALDVVVGCSDGKIHVHNIRYDEEIVTFTNSARGAVTALAFSTDGQPLLASGVQHFIYNS
ncbi:hypothetical protein ACS0TY_004096 [Phlomoides rotata]